MRKISSGNTDVSNKLRSHFHKPSAVVLLIKSPKGRPILRHNSPQLEKGFTIKEGLS